ncbi:MAG: ABC transporter ATP-binding protein [Candidatus Heimdallarchaeota archaeon]|nr:ABC transporter ATP-binding protein [Candidatus Heimdallarchaeota archaeon]MDH5645970.1 ABC transporter ATP-binding protein [Candidatus Heimdallarchaeota archaeon]
MNIIQTSDLTKKFGNKLAVNNLNLEVPEGSIFGFLGENGAGKSTTLKMLTGLTYPTSGDYTIFGLNARNQRVDIAKKIGVLIETPGFLPFLTGRQQLQQLARLKGNSSKDEIDELLNLVRIEYAADRKIKTYSTGMKQRLGLAQALLGDPELILLDEPFSGLDVKGVIEIKSLLTHLNKTNNITIFLSSHRLRDIEQICTHAMVIKNGSQVTQGTIDELLPSKKLVSIEVSNVEATKDKLLKMNIQFEVKDGAWIRVHLDTITRKQLVDELVSTGINVYYLSEDEKMSLEDFYLNQTKEIIV